MQIASRQALWNEARSGGTILILTVTRTSLTARIQSGKLAAGSAFVTVKWGDGAVESLKGINVARHTYAKPGRYTVRISDDLSSFGYTSSVTDVPQRSMLTEVVSLGSKVTSINSYAFNNCKQLRGVFNFPNVTTVGGYAFGSAIGITEYILPSMTRLVQESFYAGSSPTKIYVDSVQTIPSRFFEYYGSAAEDMYIRKKTCAEIKSMSGFPFKANASMRFHGKDGIVLGDGTIILK